MNSAEATLARTAEARAGDIEELITMPLAKLRRHQDLIEQQIGWAYKQKKPESLAALQQRSDDLMIAVLLKTEQPRRRGEKLRAAILEEIERVQAIITIESKQEVNP